MASEDLTTLDSVKAFLAATGQPATDDILLRDLIRAASRDIYGFTTFPSFRSRVYSDVYDGTGADRMMLSNYPVTSIASLNVNGTIIPATSWPATGGYPQAGYLLAPWDGRPPASLQTLDLVGSCFWRGRGNVRVTYTAGFLTSNEAATIPAGGAPVSVAAQWGPWAEDAGVIRTATGAAMTAVASNPATGQYALRPDVPGDYLFAAADAGLAVQISYSYTPADVDMACRGLVGELYRYTKRIGETSKSSGGQVTVAYKLTDMPDHIKRVLNPYERVVPV